MANETVSRDIAFPGEQTPRVLIVEDEPKTLDSLAEGLRLESWFIQPAANGQDALNFIRHMSFDLVILDWMLPDADGLQIIAELRKNHVRLPVLMLSARSSVSDRVLGLEGGADAYLPKPFAFAELLARCRALLRRPTRFPERVLRYGDLELDTCARVAKRGELEIFLSPREVDVLEYLMLHQEQNVTRTMLERDVWKQEHRMTSLDNVIDVQMGRLRRKVDADRSERVIQTVRGVGYRLGKVAA